MKVFVINARDIIVPYINLIDMSDTVNILKFYYQYLCIQQTRKEFFLFTFRKMFVADAMHYFLFLFHLKLLWSSLNNYELKIQLLIQNIRHLNPYLGSGLNGHSSHT